MIIHSVYIYIYIEIASQPIYSLPNFHQKMNDNTVELSCFPRMETYVLKNLIIGHKTLVCQDTLESILLCYMFDMSFSIKTWPCNLAHTISTFHP